MPDVCPEGLSEFVGEAEDVTLFNEKMSAGELDRWTHSFFRLILVFVEVQKKTQKILVRLAAFVFAHQKTVDGVSLNCVKHHCS